MALAGAPNAFRSLMNVPLCLAFLAACAPPRAPLASAPANGGGATASGEEPAAEQAAAASSASPGGAGRASSGSFPPLPLPGGEQPTPEKALPELRIEALGMHVGGGKNDPEEKAPFHRALERTFPAFMDCYRLAEDPWSGGSFGIDLKIPRAGGAPTAEQPRTRIRGAGFQDCMVAAFGKVQFEKPKAGPTVISYSIRFALGKGKPSR